MYKTMEKEDLVIFQLNWLQFSIKVAILEPPDIQKLSKDTEKHLSRRRYHRDDFYYLEHGFSSSDSDSIEKFYCDSGEDYQKKGDFMEQGQM